MPTLMQKIKEAAEALKALTPLRPAIGIVLGSGLGHFAEDLENKVAVSFADIPHFPKTTTEGHQGMFVIGSLSGLPVAALQGRYHYYEGLSLADVVFPIRVLQAIGVETLLLTNACGAINAAFAPGDLMVIADHLNLVGNNPLIGPNAEELGPRFPDAGEIYAKKLREIAHKIAKKNGFVLREGIYAWWSGPSYETPAEIRMLRLLGADAVGMSTVPEALAASHMGMKVLGLSCLTNMATGIRDARLTHEEVLEVAGRTRDRFTNLVKGIILELK